MTQLRDPLINTKTPPKVVEASARHEEKAAHAINEAGICPYCTRPMQDVLANKVAAQACLPCRICLPKVD